MNQDPKVDFPGIRWRPATATDVQAWAALIARTAAVENPAWHAAWTLAGSAAG